MKIKEGIPYLLVIVALALGTFYDYEITDFLYHGVPFIGEFFERIVLFPIQSVVVLTMCMLFRTSRHRMFLMLAYIASVYVVMDTFGYWMTIEGLLAWGVILSIALLYVMLLHWIVMKMSQNFVDKRLHFFLFMSIVLLSSIVITTMIKEVWGRIRYREMQDITQFCVWYKPCGVMGSKSFPSGHTTAFTAILCLLQWKRNPYEKQSVWMYSMITILIILMPISRMIMGAHFLSDTAVGFMITYSCYLLARYYFHKGGFL